MRDDFDERTKDILARRVGFRCSNPNCRALTSGPQTESTKAINIGVGAHITAASRNGPRYDKSISPEERKSIENGIWLCQNCAKLVDNDAIRYAAHLLLQWKELSEQAALLDIEGIASVSESARSEDAELLRFYSQCFDRPAFQDPFMQEGSMEAFDKAIEDTITAINTGTLRHRSDGSILARGRGKSYLKNQSWRGKMDVIVDLLRAIRSRYALAVRTNQISLEPEIRGQRFYFIHDQQVAEWMDETRSEVINVFSELCREAGIPSLRFPRHLARGSKHAY